MQTNLQDKAVAVYCSSSSAVAPIYFEAAQRLGRLLAESGARLVYGGTNIGLMGAVADAIMAAGGQTVGVIPMLLNQVGIAHPGLSELVITDGMRERKMVMEERADAFIALPGGYGTLEEIFEILTLKQLGYHQKPVVILNTNDYYGPLLAQLQTATEQHFMKPGNLGLFQLAATPDEAITYLATYQPGPFEAKWLTPSPTQAESGEVPGTE